MNKIQEEIEDLKNKFNSLFEEDLEDGESKEKNKIVLKKKKKNKEPVEVVSVADELFPYEGTAKEQFNQKVIAKINDMLQGTASLEDVINLVKRKKISESVNSLSEAVELFKETIKTLSE